ncbi:MAG: hypothetical protein QF437_13405 [Planctomycetota bacterium]|jgi:hypothetical protein|nr:hypothetical protein [Planctomycetota bacterium]MDP7131486.1 hypothetical protein [Planctomycetota bacterium]MDP7248737.1 hypothetical protein [Planctomycetota bacterium]|tara:strand:- start:43 stop:453 length:411 start_codon:yes stop_codon:yes gene_type:complete
MKLIHPAESLHDRASYLIQGIVDIPLPAAGEQDGWGDAFRQLAAWKSDSSLLEDEGVESPQKRIVRSAEETGLSLKEHGISSPERVVPDGDGGIAFRWRQGPSSWTIEFDSDGSIESYLMHEGRLIRRHSLHETAG